jgi:C-terminal processing protease CtpA/Prc
MDPVNYIAVELEKPMGIVFEENEEEFGGIFIQSLKEGSKAEGLLKEGDQLVAVGTKKVTALAFDDALGAIIDDVSEKTKLLVFRGSAKQLYGPTGASKEWLDEFVAEGGVVA